MYKTLSTQLDNNILIITINRPEKMNVINQQVVAELALAIDEIYGNKNISGAIITGSGEKAFVAGADVNEFITLTPKQGEELAKKGHVIFQRIENSPKPIIAAVNGFALGGGCELAMACHLRIASENAKFGQPEVNLGLIPGYGGTQRLTQLVGKGKSLELMMTGDMLTAVEAQACGLVNQVVKQGELIPAAITILHKIQTKAPLAIARIVKCVNAALDKNQDGFEVELKEFAACFSTSDLQEGVLAFTQKRPANFKGA